MRYLVFGAGAVGGLLGARLALAGQAVAFLGRPGFVEAVRTEGLRLREGGAQAVLPQVTLYSDAARALREADADLILLTIKAFDVSEASETIHANAPPSAVVVSFLNGIGNETVLAEAIGHERVLSATLTTAVEMPEPGLVRVARRRGVGLAASGPAAEALADDLTRGGCVLRRYPDPERMKWSKLLTNIVSNASSAILGWTPRQVYSHPGMRRLEIASLREAVRVMRALGFRPHNLPGVPIGLLGRALSLPDAVLGPLLSQMVVRGRGGKMPSFHADLARRRSEVRWLNGAVVAYGERLSIPTPANRALTETLVALVEGREDAARYAGNPDRLLRRAAAAGFPA